VQENVVVDGDAEQDANESELFFRLQRARREPVVRGLFVEDEEGFD
jgi:hypothetical protein